MLNIISGLLGFILVAGAVITLLVMFPILWIFVIGGVGMKLLDFALN